jgi:hypothetical protein
LKREYRGAWERLMRGETLEELKTRMVYDGVKETQRGWGLGVGLGYLWNTFFLKRVGLGREYFLERIEMRS